MSSISDVYDEIQPKIYVFFYIKTSNKELAEDLTQEVFYESLKSFNSFKNKSSLKTWMFSIANNLLKKHYRKKHYDGILESKLSYDTSFYEDLEDEFIKKDEKNTLMKAINCLDDNIKEIVILRIYGELSFSDIGNIIGESENYSRVNFHRAKLKIQKELEEYHGR
ncbi:MAG: RNA polymerase sigma factor [Clostridium sp.]|uniref:RNA polymerase sigma factor n=1 Tax=Clostridium sp. TaxID=1506 RepID=UPI00302353EF